MFFLTSVVFDPYMLKGLSPSSPISSPSMNSSKKGRQLFLQPKRRVVRSGGGEDDGAASFSAAKRDLRCLS